MSSEISTYLTGRYISFKIYPLSFAEYLKFKQQYTQISDIHNELYDYIRLGGFPATHTHSYTQEEIYTAVKDIYNATVFTDIVKRNQIRKVDQLERVVKYTFSNVGNTFSARSISNYFKSEHRNLDIEADTSLRYAVLGYNDDTVASSLENIVYLELCRRGYTVNIGKLGNSEIDFVATRQNEKIYIQVTQEISSGQTEKREYHRLLDIHDNYPKYVLRTDIFAGGNFEGIKSMHVADFLLSDEY
jgi:predicted AAA+ superfamily ATPase